MRLLLLATLCACGFGESTTININFEGIFEGLNWNGPSPSPSPTPKVWLPIPNASLPLTPVGQSPYDQNYYSVSEIGNGTGVYYTSNTFYNGFFIVGPNGVWIFDIPGVYVLSAIKSVTNKTITHIVYSHTHVDHIGYTGALIAAADAEGLVDDNLTIIASQQSLDHLTAMNDTRRPLPNHIVNDNETFTVGSLSIEVSVLPVTGHLDGSLIIWIPSVSLIMTVDVAFPGWAPFYHLGMAQEFDTLIPVCDIILGYNFTTFIGGHLGRVGTRADVQTQKDYINSVFQYAQEASMKFGAADFAAAYGQSNGNPWVAIKIYFDEIAADCYESLIARWGGVLAGVDVVGPDHCWVISEHLRIN